MFGLGTAATLFGVTIVVSLLGLYVAPQIIERNLFRPYWFQRRGDYWTAITSGFVHADLTHLLFNMMTFYFFAFPLERTIGPLRLLALYLFALVLSNLAPCVKQRNDPDYASLGASGAICAVLFAFVVYYPTVARSSFRFRCRFRRRCSQSVPGFHVVFGAHARGRINHDAHLDGALIGLVFVAFTEPAAYSTVAPLGG